MNTVNVKARAAKALTLKAQINNLEDQLAEYSEFFRDFAEGETTTIAVEDLGKVQISKPSAGSVKTERVLNEAAFLTASPELQKMLLDSGIISVETRTVSERKAAVKYALNA